MWKYSEAVLEFFELRDPSEFRLAYYEDWCIFERFPKGKNESFEDFFLTLYLYMSGEGYESYTDYFLEKWNEEKFGFHFDRHFWSFQLLPHTKKYISQSA